MLKFLRDLKERKTDEIREMLEQMQEMRQSRIVEVWQCLDDMPQAARTVERKLQAGEGSLVYARQKEEDILNRLSSNEQLGSWVQAWRQRSNRMLERALERAMRRALGEIREQWEWEEWEREQFQRRSEAESMRKERWEEWKWGYVKWLLESNQEKEQEKKDENKEKERRERRTTDKRWKQERMRRKRERDVFDQEEVQELELAYSELGRQQAQLERIANRTGKGRWWLRGKGTRNDMQNVMSEPKRLEIAELRLARDWEQRTLQVDLKNEDELLWLKLWYLLANWPARFALVTAKAEQELLRLEKSHRSLHHAKACLEKDSAKDARDLQEASSDWQKLNQLAQEWLSSDPTQDRLPLVEQDVKESGHKRYLLNVILGNQSAFIAQSAYLDALLVFVSISVLCPNEEEY